MDTAATLRGACLQERLQAMLPMHTQCSLSRRLLELQQVLWEMLVKMLTARHEVSDRVAGLDAGADDYVVKPFALEELSARVRSMLRRTHVSDETQNLVVADLILDLRSRTAHRGKRELILTKTEFDLLELLMQNVGIVLERDTLYDRIWGFNFETGSRSLDVYIGYLRRKTEEGGEPRVLHTIRGVGYIVRPPSESDWEEQT
mgnify:CR=1 FL=1